GQASPDGVARGRKMVLGHSGGCRSRQQSGQLAMDCGLRCRRRTLFPRVQSDPAGRKVRSRRRLCPSLGARTCAIAVKRDPPAVERDTARTCGCWRRTRQDLSAADHRSQEGGRARGQSLCQSSQRLSQRHPLYTSANPAIVRASTTLGDAMDDDKPILEQMTDAMSTAATATTDAAKTVVKKVKKAAKKVAKKKKVTPKKAKKAKKASK